MPRKLTTRQLWILVYLRDNPGATLQQIADASPVEKRKTEKLRERAKQYGWPGDYDKHVVHAVEYPTAQSPSRSAAGAINACSSGSSLWTVSMTK